MCLTAPVSPFRSTSAVRFGEAFLAERTEHNLGRTRAGRVPPRVIGEPVAAGILTASAVQPLIPSSSVSSCSIETNPRWHEVAVTKDLLPLVNSHVLICR